MLVPKIVHDTVSMIAHDTAAIIMHDTVSVIAYDTAAIIMHDTVSMIAHDTAAIIMHDTVAMIVRDVVGHNCAGYFRPHCALSSWLRNLHDFFYFDAMNTVFLFWRIFRVK